MKLKRIYVVELTVGIILFVSSCDNNGIPVNNPEGIKNGDLAVSFVFAEKGTKAYIETNKFVDKSRIGLYLTRNGKSVTGQLSEDNDYMGIDWNRNVLCEGSLDAWTLSPQINLSSQKADIYGYYPYMSGQVNPTRIPVTASYSNAGTTGEKEGCIDYMYATCSTVDKDNPVATIIMNHALSRVKVYINKRKYTNPGKFTETLMNKNQIRFNAKNKPLYRQGIMDINTGVIIGGVAGSYEGKCITDGIGEMDSDPKLVADFMVLPYNGQGGSDIIMDIEIDHIVYSIEFPPETVWERGKVNNYRLQLDGSNLIIPDTDNPVTITEWTDTTYPGEILE